MLSRKWLWGIDHKTAESEALDMAQSIMGELSRSIENDDGERAWQLIEGWVASNDARFNGELSPQWGFFDDSIGEFLHIYPQYMEDLLKAQGFSPRRIYRDLADTHRIVTYDEGGKTRYTSRKYDKMAKRSARMMTLVLGENKGI
jgi:hypothetical protein